MTSREKGEQGSELENDIPVTLAPDEAPDDGIEKAEEAPTEAEVLAALDPDPNWAAEDQAAFRELQKVTGGRDYAQRWADQWKKTQGYVTQRDQEYATLRRAFEPIYHTLQPAVQQWQQRGLNPVQGLQELLDWSFKLARSPKETLLALAQQYQINPADLALGVQGFDEPPNRELEEIKRQTIEVQRSQAEIRHAMQQRQMAEYNQQVEHALNELSAFEAEKDDSGTLKHPHVNEVGESMIRLMESGQAQSYAQAYEMAAWANPAIRARMLEDKAKREAKERAQAAKKAAETNSNAARAGKGKTEIGGDLDSVVRAVVTRHTTA